MKNLIGDRSPFQGLGRRGGVQNSWFVVSGDPTTGTNPEDHPIKIDTEIAKGTPTKRLSTADVQAIFDEVAAREGVEVKEKVYREAESLHRRNQLDAARMNHIKNSRGVDFTTQEFWNNKRDPGSNWQPPLRDKNPSMFNRLEGKIEAELKGRTWNEISRRYGSGNTIILIELIDSELSVVFTSSGKKYKNGVIALVPESLKSKLTIVGGADGLLRQLEAQGAISAIPPEEMAAIEKVIAKEQSLIRAEKVRTAFRAAGKIFLVVGAAVDTGRVLVADDPGAEALKVGGGWAGAWAAATAFSVWFAPADAAGPWAWGAHGVGALIAAGAGYYGGEKLVEESLKSNDGDDWFSIWRRIQGLSNPLPGPGLSGGRNK